MDSREILLRTLMFNSSWITALIFCGERSFQNWNLWKHKGHTRGSVSVLPIYFGLIPKCPQHFEVMVFVVAPTMKYLWRCRILWYIHYIDYWLAPQHPKQILARHRNSIVLILFLKLHQFLCLLYNQILEVQTIPRESLCYYKKINIFELTKK